MNDIAYTLYRLSVVLLMADGHEKNIKIAAITYRLSVLRGLVL